mmetsp:Transcript_9593/g.14875  ORF Transcript_9593/g.14875 Transcript_9593/m.14875 type:complete len:131 (+) Transcript_9593:172-564(+)
MSASNQSKALVFASFRRLFRARRKLFLGDDRAMRESRTAIRVEYEKNSMAPAAQISELIAMADDAAHMLTHGIVRGDLNTETGNYEVKVKAHHAQGVENSDNIQVEALKSDGNDPTEVVVTSTSNKPKDR